MANQHPYSSDKDLHSMLRKAMVGDKRFHAEHRDLSSRWGQAFTPAWTVPYQLFSDERPHEGAFINLRLWDLEPPSLIPEIVVPFLVDSGSPRTVVPDILVLSFKNTRRGYDMRCAGHVRLATWLHRAAISVWDESRAPQGPGLAAVDLRVAIGWKNPFGLLGLDAIRQIDLLSVPERMFFMPRQAQPNAG
jgi:hypothetical protein